MTLFRVSKVLQQFKGGEELETSNLSMAWVVKVLIDDLLPTPYHGTSSYKPTSALKLKHCWIFDTN